MLSLRRDTLKTRGTLHAMGTLYSHVLDDMLRPGCGDDSAETDSDVFLLGAIRTSSWRSWPIPKRTPPSSWPRSTAPFIDFPQSSGRRVC